MFILAHIPHLLWAIKVKMTKPVIAYCMLTKDHLEETQFAIRRVAPYVDYTCVVDGASTDGTTEWLKSQECKDLNVRVQVLPQTLFMYGNHYPNIRNPYLEMAKDSDWIVRTDSDEFIEEDACRDFYRLINRAEIEGSDGILFQSHDIWTYENGKVFDDSPDFWNHLMWKNYPGQRYEGHTHVHLVRPGAKNKWMKSGYKYKHVKHERRIVRNSTQWYWTTAKVADNHTDDDVWDNFHTIMQRHGHVDWHKLIVAMDRGGLAQEIKDWFIDHRLASNSEERSWFEWYFIFLHPEENVDKLDGFDRPWDYIERCRQGLPVPEKDWRND